MMPFDDEDEAIAHRQRHRLRPRGIALDARSRRARIASARALECGIVWINCWLLRDLRMPFGGVKNSGVGREGGFEALRFFTEPKNVCISRRPR